MNRVYITALTANLIFFVIGTNTAWSSPILPKLRDSATTPFDRPLTSEETSWISSLSTLGAIGGSFIYSVVADTIGRKSSMLISGASIFVSYISLVFAKVVGIYYAARFINGLAIGGIFAVAPMYIAEIAEDSNRGALGSLMNVFICLGILFSYSVGPYTPIWLFNLILAIFPGLFLVLFFFIAAESPHYYVSKHQHDLAKSALQSIRGNGNDSVEKELVEIQSKIKGEQQGTLFDIFKSKGLIRAFIICICLLGIQEFSGINAVLSYSQSIFEEAGTSLEPEICSIVIGGVQFGTSFVTPLLADRLGRKVLLLFSAVGMVLSEVPLGLYSYLKDHDKDVSSVSFLPVVCLVLYIITYNAAFATLPWTIMGEMFPTNVKAVAAALSAAFCGTAGFIVVKFYPLVSESIGMGPSFWIFASFCFIAIPFCAFYVIETKGKSLKEIQDILNSNK